MTPTPTTDASAAAQPLPPLPNLGGPKASVGAPPPNGALAAIMSGIAPIKSSVDIINGECRKIIATGTIPGAAQILGQVVALVNSLLPMAAQNLLQPNQPGGVGPGGPGGPGAGGPGPGMPPPPGLPPNLPPGGPGGPA